MAADHLDPSADALAKAASAGITRRKHPTRPSPLACGIAASLFTGLAFALPAHASSTDPADPQVRDAKRLPGVEVKSLQDAAARRAEGMPEALVLLNQSQERGLLEIAAGTLGEVRTLVADHSQRLPDEPTHRLQDPASHRSANDS